MNKTGKAIRSRLKPKCGTRNGYEKGCRCVPCRAAESRYQTARIKARNTGEYNPWVSAKPVRAHIKALAKQGIGYLTVADASGVGKNTVVRIKTGKNKFIRKQRADAILAVTEEARPDSALVPAKHTWKMIRHLLNEGFTKGALAIRLGSNTKKLRFNKKRVTAKTERKVERLYNQLTIGG